MRIPIARPILGDEEKQAVAAVLESGMIASGPRVAKFEEEFARHVGTKHAVATSNGTTALHAALIALGVGPGDEVVVPAFTFVATANAVRFTGATPVFADIDPSSFNLSRAGLAACIGERTRAVIPVHLYGRPAAMQEICELALEREIAVLGDAAQAHGAAIGNRRIGSWGACETFSFYPTKNMTCGEGGMVTTSDEGIAARVRSVVNHGRAAAQLGTYDHLSLGHNFRMTDIHAAIGLVQLKNLDSWVAKRRENARKMTKAIGDTVITPSEEAGTTHAYHQYTVRTQARDNVIRALNAVGVGHGVYYPKPLYAYPHLAAFKGRAARHAEQACREVLSLPIHPGVQEADIQVIAKAVADGHRS